MKKLKHDSKKYDDKIVRLKANDATCNITLYLKEGKRLNIYTANKEITQKQHNKVVILKKKK